MNDRILGLGALFFAAFMIWKAVGLVAPFSYEPLGPRVFPLLIASLIALCGLWLCIKNAYQAEPISRAAKQRITFMFLCILAYAIIFQWLGFVIATTLMTMTVGRLFGGSWRTCLLAGVILSFSFFLLFDRVMDVVLPTGLLGSWL